MKCISAAANAVSVEDFGKVIVEVLEKRHYNRECPAGWTFPVFIGGSFEFSVKQNAKRPANEGLPERSIKTDVTVRVWNSYKQMENKRSHEMRNYQVKKGIIKAIVLVLCFIAAVITFGYFTNQNSVNLTTEMQAASYPVISVYHKNYLVGELHGYREKMDMTTMRDCVVPLQNDRAITVEVNTFGSRIDQISYEIRSLDGERLIANRVCENDTTKGDLLHLELVLENLLEESEEYQLLFLIQSGDATIRYYTRLMQKPDEHLDDYLEFVNQFHEDTMNKQSAEQLSTYLEPDSSLENKNLNLVTINSSLQQVSWADFDCEQLTDPVLTIADLSDRYAVITLDYVLTAVGAGGELEYYNAKEYYRISYNDEGQRCYLHNFERSVNQIFRADGENFSENYIQLGIRDSDVEYKKNENGQITCFVQQGELWSYNEENGTLYRIFSFRGYEGMDIRENYDAHDIRILRISEGGSVDFAVYGYMNRGVHEGQVGVSVCHFDSLAATVEEILFIKSDKAYDRLKTDMGGVLYESAEGNLYCMMAGTIYCINTADASVRTLVEGLGSESYCSSADRQLLVWQEDFKDGGDLTVADLETEHMDILQAGKGQMLYPIGFLEDDFVYGIAESENPTVADGSVPMTRIVIYNVTSGETVKEYSKKNYFISDVSIDEYVITLQRVRRTDSGYAQAEPDTIINHEGEGILDDNICQTYDEIKQMQVQIALNAKATHTNANLVTSREVLLEELPEIELVAEHPWEGYYTYAKGRCQSFHSRIADAVREADDQMGLVVDCSLKPVWKRAKKLVRTPIQLPEGFRADDIQVSYQEAQEYDLTGCRLTQTLYYVSEGIPVLVTLENGKKQLIVGYDSGNIWLYDQDSGVTSRKTIAEAEAELGTRSSKYTAFLQ